MSKVNSRLVFLLLLLLVPISADAQKRTEKQAREEAQAFFSRNATKAVSMDDIHLLKTGNKNTFYIYGLQPGGFVIISSEKKTDTILGYSDDASFDAANMPPALEEWLENLSTHIMNFPEGNTTSGTKAGSKKTLETASWGQLSPYNNKCPEYAPAGCTALSMAIALRCIKWPDAGVGTLPGYSYEDIHKKTHTVDSLALGHPYNWEDMPLKNVTKDNADQIATIVRDCGIMIHSQYSYTDDGTAAYNEDILPALKKYMKFDASGVFSYSKCSGSAEWKEAVTAEIDGDRPVIYSGQPLEGSGHSFVVDGYDESGRFHINWGWEGEDNGYYTFPEFGAYTYSHSAIFGLKKEDGGAQSDMIFVNDMTASTEKFAPDTSFTVSFTIYNYSDAGFSWPVAMVRISDEGELKEFISNEISDSEPLESFHRMSFKDISCTIKNAIGTGDLITLAYKDRSGEWKQAGYDHEDPYSAMISISNAEHLDAATTFRYDKNTKTVTLDTKTGTTCTVSPEVGIEKKDGSYILTGFSTGTYTVKLLCGMELFSFELVL